MKTLITTLLLLGAQWAFAGDASYYDSLGFSEDGKYYAFTQDGYFDGSGYYWIELGIIHVKSNTYVGRDFAEFDPYENGEEESYEPTPKQKRQMLNKLKKNLRFGSYGFTKRPTENIKVFRPNFDHSPVTKTSFSLEYWAQGGASASIQTIDLLLKEVPAPVTANNEWCADYYGHSGYNNMIDLSLKAEDSYHQGPGFMQDLQIDMEQPKIRACSWGYQIRYVLEHEGNIAVGIRFHQPGFEGPNERFMVVTGHLKHH